MLLFPTQTASPPKSPLRNEMLLTSLPTGTIGSWWLSAAFLYRIALDQRDPPSSRLCPLPGSNLNPVTGPSQGYVKSESSCLHSGQPCRTIPALEFLCCLLKSLWHLHHSSTSPFFLPETQHGIGIRSLFCENSNASWRQKCFILKFELYFLHS